MSTIVTSIAKFMREEDGVAAIEYGLIASLVALAIIVGATLLGTKLNAMFTFISSQLKTA